MYEYPFHTVGFMYSYRNNRGMAYFHTIDYDDYKVTIIDD